MVFSVRIKFFSTLKWSGKFILCNQMQTLSVNCMYLLYWNMQKWKFYVSIVQFAIIDLNLLRCKYVQSYDYECETYNFHYNLKHVSIKIRFRNRYNVLLYVHWKANYIVYIIPTKRIYSIQVAKWLKIRVITGKRYYAIILCQRVFDYRFHC